MALIVINRIQTGAIKPSSLSTADLSELCAEWVARSPQWLPPLREQPWPLILARMTEGESAAARQEGKDALTLVRSLPAIDRIVQMLRDQATSTALWGDLADVIGGISGVRYPAGTTRENRAVAADDWMVKWDQSLKGRKDEAHRLYSWRRFEVAIDRARKDTSPEIAERVATVRGILVHQLDSPDDIPADASPYARQMLEKPLAAKQDMLGALEDLEKAVRPDEKMVAATRIRDLADTDELKGIVRLHLERLVTAVLREDDREVLDVLAGLLTAVTGVPLNLRQDSAQEREKILREWLRMLP